MAALHITILALLVFVLLYGISRASAYFSDLLAPTRSAQNAALLDPFRSGVKTAKFGARFRHS